MQDPLARAIAVRLRFRRKFHHQLSIPGQIFLIHPFHHSETLSDHDLAVKLVEELRLKADQVWSEWLDESLRFMRSHREIIERFWAISASQRSYATTVVGRRVGISRDWLAITGNRSERR